MTELVAIAEGRVCQSDRQRACQAANGPFAPWACRECQEYLRPESISPWTWHLFFLHRLQQAGYPFRAADLSLETWLLLGTVREVMERYGKRPRSSGDCGRMRAA